MKTITSISLLVVLLIVGILASCEALDVPNDTPSCIKKKIREIQSNEVRNPPGSVWQYDYNGQKVYYIPPYCCDNPSQLFDKHCNLIGNPDGGLSGYGDGTMSDFFSKRKNEKLIWQDSRK
jgi:hypothetical protein